jgi:RNA polymerase II subunit A small phosphatase-like protein
MNAVLIQRELNIKIIELVEKSIAFLDEERYESVWEILHTIRNELIQNSNVNSLQGQLSGIEERRTTEINKTADRQENSKIKNTDPILLVLDIDESFVYSSDDPLDRNANFELAGYMVTKRPYFDEFFSKVAQWYDIAIWTGATKKYADQIIDQLISAPQKLKFVWDRKHCILKLDYDTGTYYWLKDIRKIENLGYKKERILFIEDDPRSGQRNYGNLILVKPFSGADDDKELLFLADYLESLKDIANIRKIEKRYWRNPKG